MLVRGGRTGHRTGRGEPDSTVEAIMDVEALPDPAAFLEATETLRMREPVLTNLPGSIAQGVLAGRPYESGFWVVVRDAGDVVGCAVRTAPFKAVLSPMSEPAAEALGRWLAQHDPALPGLTGPEPAVIATARAMGRAGVVRMREVARVLGEQGLSQDDRPAPGRAVPARPQDVDLLVHWLSDFETEVGLQRFADRAHTAALVDDGRLWQWTVDGEPVAVGGHAPLVATPGGTVGRIGPVYTVPEHRRRGYGSAITRAVTLELALRCDRIMLFADAANLDSNSIYEAMGFAVASEIVDAELLPPPAAEA